MKNIVLASGSPRRHELLKLITEDFEVRVPETDETLPDGIVPEKAAEYLSRLKAEAVKPCENEIVIGCDTTVVIDGRILGKPIDEKECREMLSLLSGRVHTVYTGVTIIASGNVHSFTIATRVEFYPLNEKDINDYISTGEPFDKAGGYGIQGMGALLVKGIEGDYFNVVGLPVSALKREIDYII